MGMRIMMTGTTDLADFLLSIGVDVIQSGQEIKCRCPMHLKRTGKEDNNPSFYINAQTGLWLCYSCGARGNLAHLIREVTGKDDIESLTMLMEHGVDQMLNPPVQWERTPEVDFHMYLKYEDVPHRYLQSRNISQEAARSYGIRWNPEKTSWIIPVISPDNELLGWQEKGQSFVRNHPKGIKMRNTLFGIERLTSKTVVLVESPLDVVRFASSFDGIQCLATFGASITREQLDLLYNVTDKLIVALDNDHAGVASAKNIFKDLPLLRKGVFWLKYSHTNAKDIGEMTDDEIEEAVREASIVPWWL
jgi:DNA primase